MGSMQGVKAMMRRRIGWARAVVLGAGLLVGCGASEGRSTNVPGIPVYPGAELTDAWPAASVQTPEVTLNGDPERDPTDFYFVPDAEPAAVIAWYGERMRQHGWEAVGDPNLEVVIYNDAQGCYAFVSVSGVEGGVSLQISRQDPATPCVVVPTTDPGSE